MPKKVKDNEETRMTVTRAKTEYKLNEEDLKDLDCKEARNPHYRSMPPMRLYKVSDIEMMSKKKQEDSKRFEEEMSQNLYNERIGILTDKGVSVDEISEPFYNFILSDYLTSKKPKVTMTSITKQFPMMILIKELEAKWHQPDLIAWFLKYKGNSSKRKRDLMTPMMIVKEAIQVSKIIMKALSNNVLACEIAVFLDTDSLKSLQSFLLKFGLSVQQPSNYIQTEILSSIKDQSLASNNIVQKYIQFAVENPNLLGFTIKNIQWFSDHKSANSRKIALDAALKKYSLDSVRDNKYNAQNYDSDNSVYSSGWNDVTKNSERFSEIQLSTYSSFISTGYPSLSEVVAEARINEYLFSFDINEYHNGGRVYYKNASEFKKLLYQYMNNGFSVSDATAKLLAKQPKQPRRGETNF